MCNMKVYKRPYFSPKITCKLFEHAVKTWKETDLTMRKKKCGPTWISHSEIYYSINVISALSLLRTFYTLCQRCTIRAQRTVCDDECCCAVHPCTGWNGPACSWWGEGRIGNWRGRRTGSEWERQMICLLRYGGGCRFDIASSHICTVHCTRAGILCTFAICTYLLSYLFFWICFIRPPIPGGPGWIPVMWYLTVDKVALGRVFSEYFGFPCQFSFHLLFHTHQSS
jgi:hypothetical protein